MDPFIIAAVLTLEQLFAGSYRFHLPWVQRAYAWNEMHVGRLIDDVHAASLDARQRYSLGHLSLAKPGPEPMSSLIDGHQRTITLTMLFALLRDMIPAGVMSERLHAVIEAKSGAGFHLAPQASIAEFFASYVQSHMGTRAEPDGDIMDLTEAERNILANRNHMRDKIEKLLPGRREREAFAGFLLQQCWVIVEIVEDEEEAWSLLTIAEETGLELHSSERAKLSLVMEMPRSEQEDASRIYEQAQAIVGADDMSKLLGHIRTLKVRRRSSRPVENDLKARFRLDRSGLAFLVQELLPRAQVMVLLKKKLIGSGAAADATAGSLETLYWLEHQLWMPAALQWLDRMTAEHAETPLFFARLDRLAWMLKIGGADPTDQERRLMAMLDEIDRGLPVDAMPQLQIEPGLLKDALANLRSTTFYSKRHHGLVLRRIGWNLAPGHDPGAVDGRQITVEHVLPRKPPKDRRWRQDFATPAEVAAHCNRIGNLVFLSDEDNRRADTSDYVVKREILRKAAQRFALTRHAAAEERWTQATIIARSEALIGILLAPWELGGLER